VLPPPKEHTVADDRSWTAPPSTLLRPGPDFDLSTFDRGGKPGFEGDKKDGQALTAQRGELLSELQERLFAHGRAGGDRSVLLVLQGLDTAGKGGIVRHVMGMVDPQGVALASFGVPTQEDLRHHFLWRIRRQLPKPGRIGVFDRSHYEDVLVARVDNLVEEEVWQKRYATINRFERTLVERGTTVIKVALMVSHQEQGLRLLERLDRPDKHWKYSTNDITTRKKWDDYQEAYAEVFRRTNTNVAPWHVIPADRKWYSRLAVTELVTQALIDLDLGWPKPRWRVATQRRALLATMEPDSIPSDDERAELLDEVTDAEESFRDLVERAVESTGATPDEGADEESDETAKGTKKSSGKKSGKKTSSGKKPDKKSEVKKSGTKKSEKSSGKKSKKSRNSS
jgi:PPK2 family polyphosphate:nucleotide phosphotransferase